MRVLITAGPTREYIDTVRFISNASSGKMGCAVASAALAAGHEVTLLMGPCSTEPPAGCDLQRFTSVDDLRELLEKHFDSCDALIMAAAVGDFRAVDVLPAKLNRSAGPITLKLIPTEDLLAGLRERKRPGQIIVAFAVEDGSDDEIETRACDKLARKGADFIVLNTSAAMSAETSQACILSAGGVVLAWSRRPKTELATEIVRLVAGPADRS